jgi:hypothetical protein
MATSCSHTHRSTHRAHGGKSTLPGVDVLLRQRKQDVGYASETTTGQPRSRRTHHVSSHVATSLHFTRIVVGHGLPPPPHPRPQAIRMQIKSNQFINAAHITDNPWTRRVNGIERGEYQHTTRGKPTRPGTV